MMSNQDAPQNDDDASQGSTSSDVAAPNPEHLRRVPEGVQMFYNHVRLFTRFGAFALLLTLGMVGEAIAVPGMSNYCSKVWTNTNGWSFTYGAADPCSAISGGTIERAGMYSTYGLNHVIVWCDPNYIWAYDGYGGSPLAAAYQAAATTQTEGGCVFTVAPADLPIFGLPYNPNDPLGFPAGFHGSGFDFQRLPYDPPPSNPSATPKIVDFRGQNVRFINDHDAHDFGMSPGHELRAVADGVVITAGYFLGTYSNCNNPPGLAAETGLPDCGDQAIIIVKHTVKASNPLYNEVFATGYFHAQKIVSSILSGCTPVDQTQKPMGTGGICSVSVMKGQILGYSGRRNTSAAHLHFATWRLTNTARRDSLGFRAPDSALWAPSCCNYPGSVGPTLVMEPYGWRATPVTDPWAYAAHSPSMLFPNGAGALSIHLWITDPPFNW